MEEKIKMISAASKLLAFKKKNPLAIDEEVFQHVSDYITKENIKEESIKVAMIAAASKAYDISRKNPRLSEREVLNKIMNEIPKILDDLDLKKQ